MSDTWSSEIQKFTCGVIFQSLICLRLNGLKKVKRGRLHITFRPQIAASSIAEFVVWAAESAMVQICWLRVWLFCGLWFEFWMICESLLEFMEWGSRITLGFGVSISSRIQSGSGVLFLCGLLPILNSVGSWTLVKPDAMSLAFLGIIQTNKMKKRLH